MCVCVCVCECVCVCVCVFQTHQSVDDVLDGSVPFSDERFCLRLQQELISRNRPQLHTHTHTYEVLFRSAFLSQFKFITEEVPEELNTKCYSVSSSNRNTQTLITFTLSQMLLLGNKMDNC